MELFIIGNGFDLAHGLPTKYSDFRKFLKDNYYEFLYTFEEAYNHFSVADLENFLWNDLEGNLANIDDIMMEEKLHQQTDLGLESGNIGILDTMDYYFQEQFSYIEDLIIYLKEWANEVNTLTPHLNKKTNLLISSKNNKYINFNYTNTLSKVYNISKSNIVYIHESASGNDDLVLGHGNLERIQYFRDEHSRYEELFDEQSMSVYKTLFEYCEKTIKDTKFYINHLNFINFSEFTSVNILGHSLGEVDLPYFIRIAQGTNDITWNVYYYSKNEIDEMYKKLLSIGLNSNQINFIDSSKFYNL